MNNKTSGTRFEEEFAKKLFDAGFWVYNTINKASGQPADIIAARNGKIYLIDCKVCENNIFRLDRIEDNQESSMKMFYERAYIDGCYFALRFHKGEIYLCPAVILFAAKESNIAMLDKQKLSEEGFMYDLESWLETR